MPQNSTDMIFNRLELPDVPYVERSSRYENPCVAEGGKPLFSILIFILIRIIKFDACDKAKKGRIASLYYRMCTLLVGYIAFYEVCQDPETM